MLSSGQSPRWRPGPSSRRSSSAKAFTDLFTEEEKAILSVKPGITDWASIWNSDEGKILEGSKDPDATYKELIWPEKKKLQLKYVQEHTFLIDLKIVFLTIKSIIIK